MDIRNFFGGGSKKKPVEQASAKSPLKSKVASVKKAIDEDILVDSDDESARKTTDRKSQKRVRKISSPNEPDEEGNKRKLRSTPTKLQKIENEDNDFKDIQNITNKRKAESITGNIVDLSQDATANTSSKSPIQMTTAKRSTRKSPSTAVEVPMETMDLTEKLSSTSSVAAAIEIQDKIQLKPIEKQQSLAMSSLKTSSTSSLKKLTGGASEFFGVSPPLANNTTSTTVSSVTTSTTVTSTPSKSKASPKKSPKPPSSITTTTTSTTSSKVPWRAGQSRPNALKPGSREIPIGQSGCLSDMKIAVTGVFDNLSRENLEDLIQSYDGKVPSSVSGRTDYLVVGSVLDDGRPVEEGSKYRAAKEKKVKILTEDEFLDLIQNSNNKPAASNTPKDTSTSTSTKGIDHSISNSGGKANSRSVAAATTTTSTTTKAIPASSSSSSSSTTSNANLLWVDKYKPASVDDIIGCSDTVKKLCDWLQKWDSIHLHHGPKPAFQKENPGAKAVLLSGPPGIGKTTMATLTAAHNGYEVLELNASDTRNKGCIVEKVSDVVLSMAISMDGSTKRRVVIMDEVDGMGGSDRGGIPELIKVIKSSKSPIICICNDRQAQKIRSLANHCYDLRVRRPMKNQIASRAIKIAAMEGLQVDMNAAECLVEQVGNDIRQVLHAMQMWSAQSTSMRYSELKDGMKRIEKDKVLRQSPFDACMLILGGDKQSTDLNERYNSFFIDYSLVPLLVQQNYVDASKGGIFRNPKLSEIDRMNDLAQAAAAVSDMELASATIRGGDMHWDLLPIQAATAVRVGHIVQGFQAFPTFPAWLGKYSTTGKMKRLTSEIVTHTSLAIGQGFSSIRLEYVPYMRSILLQQLLHKGAEGVPEVLALLDSYGLSKDDFSESLKELQFVIEKDPLLSDGYEAIESKIKAALTREYNNTEHKSQALVSTLAIKKGKKGGGRGGDDDDEEGRGTIEDLDAAKEEAEDEGDDDVGDVSEFIKKQRKGKAASSSSSSKAGNGGSSAAAAGKGKGKSTATKNGGSEKKKK